MTHYFSLSDPLFRTTTPVFLPRPLYNTLLQSSFEFPVVPVRLTTCLPFEEVSEKVVLISREDGDRYTTLSLVSYVLPIAYFLPR